MLSIMWLLGKGKECSCEAMSSQENKEETSINEET
jgi:hypothetical protein